MFCFFKRSFLASASQDPPQRYVFIFMYFRCCLVSSAQLFIVGQQIVSPPSFSRHSLKVWGFSECLVLSGMGSNWFNYWQLINWKRWFDYRKWFSKWFAVNRSSEQQGQRLFCIVIVSIEGFYAAHQGLRIVVSSSMGHAAFLVRAF